jgi:hypothetical protein
MPAAWDGRACSGFPRPPESAAARTADAAPSRGGLTPFFLTMFNIVTGFLLALDGNSDLARCLSHVGTEGFGVEVVTAQRATPIDSAPNSDCRPCMPQSISGTRSLGVSRTE